MRILQRFMGGGDDSIARARRPEALAASLGEVPREGIDWLGRAPDARAPLLYRLILSVAGLFLFRVCRLRLEVIGREHLPTGGYLVISALHRSWIDPLLLVRALPLEPRIWFMGSGPTSFDRPWKERLLHRTGGLLPVWRGGTDVSVHVRSAQAVIDGGAVLALFAEGRIGEAPDAPSRLRTGAALLALRTGAPIVPIALCGAEELYRGKRMTVRILEPTSATDLLGPDREGPVARDTRDELRRARAITEALTARLGDAIASDHPVTLDPPGAPRHWRWLTRLMR